MLQTLWRLTNDRLGFEPEQVLAVSIPFKGTKLETGNRDRLVSGILDFARHVPGVEYAAQSECTPLTGGPGTTTFSRSDRPRPQRFEPGNTVHVCGAGADYSKAAGLRVFEGRFFLEDDFHRSDTLAVMNETAARRFFPGEDALGKQILGTQEGPNSPVRHWKTVVGVISDSKNGGLDSPAAPQVFVNAMSYPDATKVRLLLRCAGDRHALESILSGKLRSIDSGLTADTSQFLKRLPR